MEITHWIYIRTIIIESGAEEKGNGGLGTLKIISHGWTLEVKTRGKLKE